MANNKNIKIIRGGHVHGKYIKIILWGVYPADSAPINFFKKVESPIDFIESFLYLWNSSKGNDNT